MNNQEPIASEKPAGDGPPSADAVVARESIVGERLEAESPDGRPPTSRARHWSKVAFAVAAVVVLVVVLRALYIGGGVAPMLIALVLIVVFIGFAAWPVWRAAGDRTRDRHVAEKEIESELGKVPPAEPNR